MDVYQINIGMDKVHVLICKDGVNQLTVLCMILVILVFLAQLQEPAQETNLATSIHTVKT